MEHGCKSAVFKWENDGDGSDVFKWENDGKWWYSLEMMDYI